MMYINAKIFELFDEKFDLVLFWIASHVAKLFVFVPGNNLVDCTSNAIGDSNLGLVGRA